MIKSYKIVIIIQFIILLIFSFVFHNVEYDSDIPLIATVPLLLIGFSPLILLAISIIIQRLIVAVIYSDLASNEVDKEVSNDKFWKNSFFVSLIFGVLTFLSSIVSLSLKLKVGIVASDYVSRFFVSLGILIISSLIISLFLRIKESVNEITKLLGFLMLFISVIVFAGCLYISIVNVVTIRSYGGESTIEALNVVPETEEVAVSKETEGEGEETESDYYGFNEMSFPDIETKEYFKELFGDDKYDDSKTQDLLKLFLSRFLDLQNGQSFMEIRSAIERGFFYDEYLEIHSLDKKLRRNPDAIRETFDSYNSLIYAFLSDKIYFESNLNLLVDALVKSHNDIYSTENPEEELNKIYKTMIFGSKKEFPDYYYGELSPYASEEVMNLMQKNAERNADSDNKEVNYSSQFSTVWIYSFWARRHKEKNSDVTFEILQEIKEHYENKN